MDRENYSQYLARLNRLARGIKDKQPFYKKLGIGLDQDDIEAEYPEVFANKVLSDALVMTIHDHMFKKKQSNIDYWDDGLIAKGRPGLKTPVYAPVTADTKKIVQALHNNLLAKKPFRAYFDENYKLLNDPSSKNKLTEEALKKARLMVDWDANLLYDEDDVESYRGDIE